jgi:hypothetical protein
MCGCCDVREADVIATVPMCGERPRYPICGECLDIIGYGDYAEDIEPIHGWIEGQEGDHAE